MHGGSMDRQPTRKWASVGKLIAAHEFCLWLFILDFFHGLPRVRARVEKSDKIDALDVRRDGTTRRCILLEDTP